MFFGEEELGFMDILIHSICLFVVMFVCHYIPKMTGMGKKGEKWVIIISFGLLIGIVFNITVPGSLLVVTEAFEDYNNSTETEEVMKMLSSLRRLHGGDDDDDDDDDNFRRIIGVAICLGFMILFLVDYIAKNMTKKQREQEVALPVEGEAQVEKKPYTLNALRVFFANYYIFTGLGCMGAWIANESDNQRIFLITSQTLCLLPTCFIYGKQLFDEKAGCCRSTFYYIELTSTNI